MLEAVIAAHVVTMSGPVLSPGWIAFDGGRVTATGSGTPPANARIRDAGPGRVVIPGLVSAHTHLPLGGLRLALDDRPFLPWLAGLLPIMQAHATDSEFWSAGASATAQRLLAGGVTLVGDNHYRDEGVHALRATGQRGVFFHEVFGSLAPDEEAHLQATRAALDALPQRLGEFPFGYSPHTPWTCPRKAFRLVAERASAEGRRLSFHLSESREEHEFLVEGRGPIHEQQSRQGRLDRYEFGSTPTAMLERIGALGPHVLVAHAVHVTPEDIVVLARTGTHVAHCPTSNMQLAEGFAPIRDLVRAGVNVALGLDSVASNARCDMFEEMRLMTLVQRARTGEIGPFTPEFALRAATLNGARGLGLERDRGSLEPGKCADFVVLDVSQDLRALSRDPVGAIVFGCSGADVEEVTIDGVMRHRRRGAP